MYLRLSALMLTLVTATSQPSPGSALRVTEAPTIATETGVCKTRAKRLSMLRGRTELAQVLCVAPVVEVVRAAGERRLPPRRAHLV